MAEAAAAAVLWGSIGVAYRLGVQAGADGAWLILGRPLLAALASPVAALLGAGRPGKWSIAVGLLGLAPLYATYFLAVSRIGAALASILLYTAPAWVALASGPLLGEPPGGQGLASMALGLAGAVLAVGPGGGSFDAAGVLLGLASGVSYAAYILLSRYAQLRGAGVAGVAVHSLPFAALGVTAVARPRGPPGLVDLAYASYLACAGTLVPYTLSSRALRRLEAHRVAVVSLVEPVTAVVLAWLLLGERLSPLQALGAAMVLASSLLATGGVRAGG